MIAVSCSRNPTKTDRDQRYCSSRSGSRRCDVGGPVDSPTECAGLSFPPTQRGRSRRVSSPSAMASAQSSPTGAATPTCLDGGPVLHGCRDDVLTLEMGQNDSPEAI